MTMCVARKLGQVTNEMRNNGLSILGNSEARYFGSVQHKLATGELLLCSGHGKAFHPMGNTASVQISTERTNWLGSTWLPDHQSFFQNNRKEDSHEHRSVLCSYKWLWWSDKGGQSSVTSSPNVNVMQCKYKFGIAQHTSVAWWPNQRRWWWSGLCEGLPKEEGFGFSAESTVSGIWPDI